MNPWVDGLITSAIGQRKLLQFVYHGLNRIAEPHVFGFYQGKKQLLAYQTGGSSSRGGLPEWRRFDVSAISDITILPDTFPGPRETKSGGHTNWDRKIALVE